MSRRPQNVMPAKAWHLRPVAQINLTQAKRRKAPKWRRAVALTIDLRQTRNAIVALRLVSSVAWLDSALIGKDAKLAPGFLSGAGLAQRVHDTFVHTALTPAIATLLRGFVLPHPQVFAVAIAAADLVIGLSLALGLLTRVGAAVEIARAVVNILIGGGAGTDTIGFNAMLVTAGAIAFGSRAGRRFGLDRMLLARNPNSQLLRLLT